VPRPSAVRLRENGRICSLFPGLRQIFSLVDELPSALDKAVHVSVINGLIPERGTIEESDHLARQFVALVSDAAIRG
jgi:hypothetical protein